MRRAISGLVVYLVVLVEIAAGSAQPPSSQNRVFEWTFESRKAYADPFNDVDVDVIFSKDGTSWRVPTFWRGGSEWTVRFAPPSPGEYAYRLESTDKSNPDLNGQEDCVRISAYTGTNVLLRHGMLRVSANKRYFEHADGTPFYWLGDTWWQGLSGRLSWEGFQKLTADRKAKGFTVVQIVAGLVPLEEPPSDPGCCNEGGCVWESGFKRINPKYFDFADRRIEFLLDNGLVPAIVGGWSEVLGQMGVAKMQKHWRYIIARYGAYPVFWIVGGEVVDPPEEVARRLGELRLERRIPGGWTEVTRYIRATDPYHHPVTIHEVPPPYDFPTQDESLMDFDLFQCGHSGWPNIAVEVAQLNMHYARTTVTKPLVVGEIGYENHHNNHFEDFQRTALWLSMLNGAAGYTYGADAMWGAQTGDKPLFPWMLSFRNWEEAMTLPGSYQIGLGSKLLRQYHWWRFEPHPEWVTPRGTTLLEPNDKINGFDIDLMGSLFASTGNSAQPSEADLPAGEWKKHNGNFRLPYAAGIPGEVRFIYMPHLGLFTSEPHTVLGLEPGVRYHAYLWDPIFGEKFDLGAVERPTPGEIIRADKFEKGTSSAWTDYGATKSARGSGKLSATGAMLTVLNGVSETNLVAAVDAQSNAEAGLVLRYQDADNYLAAIYNPKEKAIYLLDRKKGVDGKPLGKTPVPEIGSGIRLTAEVRGAMGAVSVTDGRHTYMTPIVDVIGSTWFMPADASNIRARSAGLMHRNDGTTQSFSNFELRRSPTLVTDEHLERKLYDAQGGYRGELSGPGWEDFGKNKIILLDAYRPPERLPNQDWVLVLEARK